MSVAYLAGSVGAARKTTAQRLAATPGSSSLVFDTDTLNLYVGDGVTVGGQAAPGSGTPINGVLHSVGNRTESVNGPKTFIGNTTFGGTLLVGGNAAFASIVTAPTALSGTNTTQVATTAFVQAAVVGIGGGASRTFGVSGTPTLNATTPPLYLDRAYTCDGAVGACDTPPTGGAASITLESSTDGIGWSTLVVVSIAAGTDFGIAPCTAALAAGTRLRGRISAVNGVANMTVTISLKG